MPTQKDLLHVVMTNMLRDLTGHMDKADEERSYPGPYGDVPTMLGVIYTMAENGKIPPEGREELVQALKDATEPFVPQLGLRCAEVITSIRAQAEGEVEAEATTLAI